MKMDRKKRNTWVGTIAGLFASTADTLVSVIDRKWTSRPFRQEARESVRMKVHM
jgi:hypothetical protein